MAREWPKSARGGSLHGLIHEVKPLRYAVYVEKTGGAGWVLFATEDTEFKAKTTAEKLCKKHDARARVYDREAEGFEH